MHIYEPEAADALVNLRAATSELRAAGSITSESAKRAAIAEIQTAALLDIAYSLRVVAAEARAAMPDPFADSDVEATPEGGEPGSDDFLTEGDLVAVDGIDDPAEVVDFGTSEGTFYAHVRFPDGAVTKVWLENLTRLVGDDRDDESMQRAAERSIEIVSAERVAEMAGEPALRGDLEGSVPTADLIDGEPPIVVSVEADAEDLVDDIDADFEGDEHPAAASALDVLKANEAARKAAKKKAEKSATKKGKKS